MSTHDNRPAAVGHQQITPEALAGVDPADQPLPLQPGWLHRPGTYSISYRTGQRVDGPPRGLLRGVFGRRAR